MSTIKRVTVAFTGASGLPYGFRLLECLLHSDVHISLVCSHAAYMVAKEEMGWKWPTQPAALRRWFLQHMSTDHQTIHPDYLHVFGDQDWNAHMASGSNPDDAMIICPCTMGTVAAIAAGLSDTLIKRAADVMLKEKRPLILVPRETPFSTLHLDNLLKLSQYGATILPPSPGFYHHPQNIADLIDFVVARILDQLGIPNRLVQRWGEKSSTLSDEV